MSVLWESGGGWRISRCSCSWFSFHPWILHNMFSESEILWVILVGEAVTARCWERWEMCCKGDADLHIALVIPVFQVSSQLLSYIWPGRTRDYKSICKTKEPWCEDAALREYFTGTLLCCHFLCSSPRLCNPSILIACFNIHYLEFSLTFIPGSEPCCFILCRWTQTLPL